MTDVADEIRRAVGATRPTANTPQDTLNTQDEFAQLRAYVRGVLIDARRNLSPGTQWSVIDDRILDTVTNWLESLRK